MRVHNADLYLDILHNADWTPSANCVEPTPSMTKLHEARLTLAAMPGRKGGSSPRQTSTSFLPPVTALSKRQIEEELVVTERTIRQRDAFQQKQRIREDEVRTRLEASMQETQKRAKERALAREAEFDSRCKTFCDDNRTIIDEVNSVIHEESQWLNRKRERLFAEWTAQVFQPMQDHIDEQLATMSHDDVVVKRRYMFQAFLDEANRKRGGVFRDIIIASDYDPLSMAKEATMSYRKAPATTDPTENRFDREAGDPTLRALKEMRGGDGLDERTRTTSIASLMASRRGPGVGTLGLGAPREASLPVRMWSCIDVTPYGRYAADEIKVEGDSPQRSPKRQGHKQQRQHPAALSHVVMDHYSVPTGVDGSKLLSVEMQARGKKVFDKPQSNVF